MDGIKTWVGKVERITSELSFEGWFWLCLTFFCLLSASYATATETGREVVAAWPFWLVVGLGVAGWPLTILFTVLAGRSKDDELGQLFFLGFIFGPVASGFFDGLCLRYFSAIPSVWCAVVTTVCAFALWVVAYVVE